MPGLVDVEKDRLRHAGEHWTNAMLCGDFNAAWQVSDALLASGAVDPHQLWQGENLQGQRVIVRSLHGLGDAVQMMRYAPLLKQRAASVIYEVAPRLRPLACLFHGVEEVITWGDEAPPHSPAWDVQVEIMQLPYLFRTTLQALPIARRYLRLPSAIARQTAAAMGAARRPRVGMVWSGGDWNRERSIPLALLEGLVALHPLEFWSLQGGASATEMSAGAMIDARAVCGDGLIALSATIAQLDLVITVDTLAAHLAGALGKPVWVLLQHAADWRWMSERQDSPWYPEMRIFRQPSAGNWVEVVREISSALKVFAS